MTDLADHPAAPVPDLALARIPGLLRRLATMLYDLVLALAVVMVAATLLVIPVTLLGGDLTHGLPRLGFQLWLLAVFALYYVYFWSDGRQTLGMRAWRTTLLRADGAPLTAADAWRRFGWAALTLAPAGFGLWWVLFDRDGLSWYDRLSATRPVLLARPGRASTPRS